jgi:SAM-dependent methyltransferase
VDIDAYAGFTASGWDARAANYHRFIGQVSARLVEPLLDAASVRAGMRVLDVATGPGYAAGGAANRGADVVGVDIAPGMVALARELNPGPTYREADAYALPFDDGSFDAVVGNFIVLHLAEPERAAAEFARVLAPGGSLALTCWDAPDRAPFVGIFFAAIADAGARHPEGLPPGPDFFRFADAEQFDALLRDQALVHRAVQTIPLAPVVASPDDLWHGVIDGAARLGGIISSQPEDVRRRIREHFDLRMTAFERPHGYAVPGSVRLAAGRRPA